MNGEPVERNGTLKVLGVGIVVAALLIGIFVLTRGDEDGDDGDASSAPITVDPSELVPATDASLIAVALEHIDVDPRYFEELYREDGGYTKGTVGGDIRFGGGEGDDGDLLRLIASPRGTGSDSCEYYECAEIQTGAGKVTLFWALKVPEEDPGVVGVEMERDGMELRIHENGPAIEADPRELELPVSVDEMIAILTDPRFGIETTPEMIEAGDELGFPSN